MATGNGEAKRPFGPHGEGCDCDPDNPQEHPEHEQTTRGSDKHVAIRMDNSHPVEIMLAAIAESYAAAFARSINTCAYDGEPLTSSQLTHLLAGVMQGHSLARQSIDIIMASFYSSIRETQAEPQEESGASALQDISELFHRKPEEDESA